jgi:hypothetical protein
LQRRGDFFAELAQAQFGTETPLGTVLHNLDAPVVPHERA